LQYELDQCDISPSVQPCTGVGVPAGSRAFVNAVNQMFAKAATRGVTLLAASGDSGAHGRTDPSCADAATRSDFPSSSPYVLSVGATEIAGGTTSSNFQAPICSSGTLSCASGGSEIVASNKVLAFFSSGGGFSRIAARPSYQVRVVGAAVRPCWAGLCARVAMSACWC
jgi:subtilase family serine protease